MKHSYEVANKSNADTLWRAREALKVHMVSIPDIGRISVYALMRKLHSSNSLHLKSFIPSDSEQRIVTLIQGCEVPLDIFGSAVTLVTEWGYDSTTEVLSWGTRMEWEKRGLRKR